MNYVFMKNFVKKYAYENKKKILIIALVMLTCSGLELLLPQILGEYVDSLNVINIKVLSIIAASYLVMVIISVVVNNINIFLCEKLGWEVCDDVRAELVERILEYGSQYQKTNVSGELVEKIEGDVNFLFNFFSSFLVNIVGSGLIVVGIIIFFFTKSIWLGLCFLFISSLIMIIFIFSQKSIANLWRKTRISEAKAVGRFREIIGGRKDIIYSSKEGWSEEQLKSFFLENEKENIKASFWGNLPSTLFYSLLNIGEGITLAIGVFLYYKRIMAAGELYVLVSYVGLLNMPFMTLKYELSEMPKINAALCRIQEIMEYEPEKEKIEKQFANNYEEGMQIEFKDVSFSYDKKIKNLNNISFAIKSGEKVLIKGRTGSGKSTILQLLSKMILPSNGEILINNIDLKECIVEDYYANLAYVLQKVPILEETVYNNITKYKNTYSRQQVEDALEIVGLREWVNSLKYGMDTIITPDSVDKDTMQLLNWAGILLKNPCLLLIDEMDSFVSQEIVNKIDGLVEKYFKNATIVMVTHKFKSNINFDMEFSLKDGEIFEITRRRR